MPPSVVVYTASLHGSWPSSIPSEDLSFYFLMISSPTAIAPSSHYLYPNPTVCRRPEPRPPPDPEGPHGPRLARLHPREPRRPRMRLAHQPAGPGEHGGGGGDDERGPRPPRRRPSCRGRRPVNGDVDGGQAEREGPAGRYRPNGLDGDDNICCCFGILPWITLSDWSDTSGHHRDISGASEQP